MVLITARAALVLYESDAGYSKEHTDTRQPLAGGEVSYVSFCETQPKHTKREKLCKIDRYWLPVFGSAPRTNRTTDRRSRSARARSDRASDAQRARFARRFRRIRERQAGWRASSFHAFDSGNLAFDWWNPRRLRGYPRRYRGNQARVRKD